MTQHRTARRRTHRSAGIRRRRAAALLAILAALAVALGQQGSGRSLSRAVASPFAERIGAGAPEVPARAAGGAADGAVPDGATVFDDGLPGVDRLDPALRDAVRAAAADAAADGVTFVLDSGWRSRDYQAQLLREAIARYGSEAEAARWVATPERSAHVTGDAVDLGPDAATAWLAARGAAYGLCRIYDNEPWHFELRAEAPSEGCPPTYADAGRR